MPQQQRALPVRIPAKAIPVEVMQSFTLSTVAPPTSATTTKTPSVPPTISPIEVQSATESVDGDVQVNSLPATPTSTVIPSELVETISNAVPVLVIDPATPEQFQVPVANAVPSEPADRRPIPVLAIDDVETPAPVPVVASVPVISSSVESTKSPQLPEVTVDGALPVLVFTSDAGKQAHAVPVMSSLLEALSAVAAPSTVDEVTVAVVSSPTLPSTTIEPSTTPQTSVLAATEPATESVAPADADAVPVSVMQPGVPEATTESLREESSSANFFGEKYLEGEESLDGENTESESEDGRETEMVGLEISGESIAAEARASLQDEAEQEPSIATEFIPADLEPRMSEAAASEPSANTEFVPEEAVSSEVPSSTSDPSTEDNEISHDEAEAMFEEATRLLQEAESEAADLESFEEDSFSAFFG